MSQPLSPLNQESNSQSAALRPATVSNGVRMADLNAARLRAAYLLYPNLAPHNIDMNNDDFITVSGVNMNMNNASSIDVPDAASLHTFDTQARLRIVEVLVNQLDTKVTKLEVDRERDDQDHHDAMEGMPIAWEARIRALERRHREDTEAFRKEINELKKAIVPLQEEQSNRAELKKAVVALQKDLSNRAMSQQRQQSTGGPSAAQRPGPDRPTSAAATSTGFQDSITVQSLTQKIEPGAYISDVAFVQFLRDMDCTKHDHLVRLQGYLSTPYSREFLLFVKSNTERFFLRIGGRNRQVFAGQSRNVLDLNQTLQSRENFHKARASGLMEMLVLGARDAPAVAPATTSTAGNDISSGAGDGGNDNGNGNNIPRYVVDIGEVHAIARNTKTEDERRTYTNYHAVMDVGTRSKALWLIYQPAAIDANNNTSSSNRTASGSSSRPAAGAGGVNSVLPPRGPRHAEFLPARLQPAGWAGFTIAQVAEGIERWRALDDADVSSPQTPIVDSPELIGETASLRRPVFALPIYAVALRTIGEGWAGAGAGAAGNDEEGGR